MKTALKEGLIRGGMWGVWALCFYGTIQVMYELGLWGVLR